MQFGLLVVTCVSANPLLAAALGEPLIGPTVKMTESGAEFRGTLTL